MEKTLTINNDHFYDFPGSTSSKSYITSNQEISKWDIQCTLDYFNMITLNKLCKKGRMKSLTQAISFDIFLTKCQCS